MASRSNVIRSRRASAPPGVELGVRVSSGPYHQDRAWLGDDRRRGTTQSGSPMIFPGAQELHHALRDLSRVTGVGTPTIFGRRIHAGLEVEVDQSAAQLMDGLLVHDRGWHEQDGSAKRHRF